VSYRHLSGLLAFYGEDGLTVAIGPLAVDGLMVMATGALIATGARRAAATGDASTAGDGSNLVASVTSDATPPASTAEPAADRPAGADVDDLLLVGRAVAAELEHAGTALTRAALIDGVRARGRRISTTRATELLRQLKAA
jgi:hypothetical protein